MRIKLSHITPLLAAGAAALAILAAPTAAAAATPLPKTCVATGAGTMCQSPGNVEINNPLPPIVFHPYEPCPGCSAATDTGGGQWPCHVAPGDDVHRPHPIEERLHETSLA